ncbi:ABC transporter substrate-binding protein [Gordonia neofelifaecis]|uniref:ABC peptide transporter, substrate-binding component n=1 Tax=Gordonia neofelifaecis NRRL B-59395 TaxID=644548 RepID=F1YMC6_9ACTN|nr:ABC transporter substrate-binding protein [Gordonia neofelifaecis]EGD54175.1 ABC peptide transporter, substrate-binding component [Gordonia neofelifaecis NRRL B-59395]
MFRNPRSRIPWVLLLTVVGVLGLGGCRSAVDAQQSTAPRTGPVTAGGELRVGVLGDLQPKTFLQIGTGGVNGHVLANVYDTLVTYDRQKLSPRPSLATSWALTPDGKSLSLTLRDGVRFHDGRPFTSADVRASLLAYLDGPWTPQFKRTAAAITNYDVSDPHRVVLTFAHPVGNIFDLLDSAPVLDGSQIDQVKAGKSFNGTGPFRFDSWTPNSSVHLTRNTGYWGGAAPLDSITFVEARDPKSLYTRLRTGQLDVASGLTDNDHEIATRRYGFSDIQLTGGETQVYVGVNVKNPALADPRVRRAIAYAVDRDRIIKDVYRNSGYPVNLPWPKTSPAYDEAGNRTYRRDVQRARDLLRDAGPIPPIDLDYTTGGSDRIVAEIVQSNLREIGITSNLVPNDRTIQATKLIGGQFSGLWILQHAFAQFTPSTLAVSAYPFNAAKNASGYSNPEYSAAADAAWKTADPASPQPLDAYRRLDRVWLDDLFLIEIGVVIPNATAAPGVRDIDWDRRDQLHFAHTNLSTSDRRS